MGFLGKLGDPVTYSVRRRYLDRDLDAESGHLEGDVLEIGCGRIGRRGRFRPPTDGILRWIYLDRDIGRSPSICADATSLPFAAGTFDVVMCLEVLEYVADPHSALTEIGRALRPGGALLVSTPFLHRADAADDYWRFTEAGLRRLLEQSGFEVVRCLRQGNALAAAVGALRHVVSVQRPSVRRVLSVALRPLFEALLWADPLLTRRRPSLGAFTTGYLFVARTPAGR